MAEKEMLPDVRRFESVGSTNDEARAWAREGAPHLGFVVAREQTGGRGRRGRSWSSPAGRGFYGSLIVRPAQAGQSRTESGDGDGALLLSRWTVSAAVGVARAIEALGLRAQLKWPNDVLLGGRKVAGILCEADWYAGQPQFLVVGVGVNVLHERGDLPERPLFPATSLLLERPASGVALGMQDAERALITALRQVAGELEGGGWPALRRQWEERCAGLGELASVSESGRKSFGVLRGLDEGGALLLSGADGPIRVISGDVGFE